MSSLGLPRGAAGSFEQGRIPGISYPGVESMAEGGHSTAEPPTTLRRLGAAALELGKRAGMAYCEATVAAVDLGWSAILYLDADRRQAIHEAHAAVGDAYARGETSSLSERANQSVAPNVLSASAARALPGTGPLPATHRHAGERTVTTEHEPRFGVRLATAEDIPRMVDIDMQAFSKVYENTPERRQRVEELFRHRYELLGGKWMPVVTLRDHAGQEHVVGFMHTCPTNKDPANFESWEKTTDDGRLDSLYEENGRNLYVVTLSMSNAVSGELAENMLIMQQMGTMIAEGKDKAYFESRMPKLRSFVKAHYRHIAPGEKVDVDNLDSDTKEYFANLYFHLTTKVKDKTVRRDPLLRKYEGVGCKPEKVVPGAYTDPLSMNFGVLYTYENPVPQSIRNSTFAKKVVGPLIKLAAKWNWLTKRVFGREVA